MSAVCAVKSSVCVVCCLYLCLGVTVGMEPLGLVHVRRVRREELGLCLCAVCIYVWALR